MEIEGEYEIAANRDVVWTALNDTNVLEKCIPGCESLEKISDTEFIATVKAAIGPVRTKFNTSIMLEDMNPPESYTMRGEAKGGAAGFGRGSAAVTLTEKSNTTLLHYAANFKVGGKLAQVGSRLVLGVTRKTADEFFGAFSSSIDPGAVRIHDEKPVSSSRGGKKLMLVAFALLVLTILWFLLR